MPVFKLYELSIRVYVPAGIYKCILSNPKYFEDQIFATLAISAEIDEISPLRK